MANKEVNIYFKVDGLDGYITDLGDLKRELGSVDSATQTASHSTDDFNDNLDRSRDKVTAFKGAVDILGGSVEVLVGGLGLIGAQPAWLESIEEGALNAFAFADGLSRLADGVNDVREFMNTYTTATKANTVAVKAQDTATKAATATTRTFSTVLKGAGIGLAIAGLAALVANWEKVLGFLGLGTKEFDNSLDKTIKKLEEEQAIQDIRGQSQEESLEREQKIARLRAENAINYVAYLESIGASEEEINAARIEAEEQLLQLRLANERVAQNTRDRELADTVAYYESVAFYTKQAADYEFYSLNERKKQNALYYDAQREIARKTIKDEEELYKRLEELNSEQAYSEVLITQQSWDRRLDIAQNAVSAIIALNEATAGATEAEQRKAFERNKKLQIGLATIQTAQAVTAALTAGGNPVKLATGAQFVEAGIAAATGLAQIIAIKKQQFDGEGGTIPNVSSNPASSINYNFGQTAGEELTLNRQGANGQTQAPPIRAYVTVNDVNNAQQAQLAVDNLSRL